MTIRVLHVIDTPGPGGAETVFVELATWLRGHDRSRFLLTAPPLRLPGVVGSPLTPIATV